MIWIQIYVIGMSITAIELIISAIRENIFMGQTPMINITIIFLALVLWPIFNIVLIINMLKIYNKENKIDRF